MTNKKQVTQEKYTQLVETEIAYLMLERMPEKFAKKQAQEEIAQRYEIVGDKNTYFTELMIN